MVVNFPHKLSIHIFQHHPYNALQYKELLNYGL